MNLSVIKDNNPLFQVDLAKEVEGNDGASLTFFVGRSDACQVVLDDKQVSREHAKITYSHGEWSIQKAADFNTLILNGANCDEAALKNGDLINIGPYTLNVSLPEIIVDTNQSTELPIDDDMEFIDSQTEEISSVDVGLGSEEATELLTDSNFEEDLDIEELGTGVLDDDLGDLDDLEQELSPEEGGLDEISDEFSDELDEQVNEEELAPAGEFEDGGGLSDEYGEEGFSEDGYGEEEGYDVESFDDDDEKTQVLKSFANFVLEIFGEFAPYDKFNIEKAETFIGRDPEKCDIVLNDPEVSGVHAVIKKNAITCTLEDLKSANGTILNGERVNTHDLTSEDEFLIGSTSFTVKIQSDFIDQEKDRIMPVEENQVVEVQEVVEVDENFEDEDGNVIEGDLLGGGTLDTKPKSLFSKEALKNPEQRKKLLYIAVGLLVLWILLDEGDKPKAPVQKPKPKVANEKIIQNPNQKVLTPEETEFVEGQYLLAKQYFNEGKYSETIMELDKIFAITPDYKKSKQIKALAKEGLERISRLLEEERKEKERKEREAKVRSLLVDAKDAVSKNQVGRAENLFKEVLKLDPENFEVTQLKLQIDAYKKEQERIALEKAQKEAERKRQLQELSPGKTYYLSKDWYKAMLKLQDFLKGEGLDEDLIREASDMLDKSKQNLNAVVNPLIGKARSLKEGQDLKGAYELYLEILQYHPAHEEALNEMDDIRNKLEIRSKRVYREAIIAESLSLYNDAKEKFQEVQQISPTDSDYYQKATEKLKDYLD
ncbi:MAG: FHA domain-containing protein [Bacteriovoracaceae bacterium]|nr:FHA domain-containing protein [Bacteriovoracaceae bacterium]